MVMGRQGFGGGGGGGDTGNNTPLITATFIAEVVQI